MLGELTLLYNYLAFHAGLPPTADRLQLNTQLLCGFEQIRAARYHPSPTGGHQRELTFV